MTNTKARRALAAICLISTGPISASAQPYQVVYLHNTLFTETGGSAVFGAQQVGVGFLSGQAHAALWTGTPGSIVDLHPTGFVRSDARATSGTMQIGSGLPNSGSTRALLWSGTAASFVDLTPPGWNFATGDGIDGNQQVGSGAVSTSGGPRRALLWSGTAASYIDLHPLSGWQHSYAESIHAGQQVGQVINDTSGGPVFHAALWSGTAASFVDLHPSGGLNSIAHDVYSGEQVGDVFYTGTNPTAALWNSSGYVDLHPSGFTYSSAQGLATGIQVGWGSGAATGGQTHALAWYGTAASMHDLHQYLLPNYITSGAAEIDPVTGIIIGGAFNLTAFRSEAVMWIPIPEPRSVVFAVWAVVGGVLAARRGAVAHNHAIPGRRLLAIVGQQWPRGSAVKPWRLLT